jgi:proprotein convertase subtilisin/kexin type 5
MKCELTCDPGTYPDTATGTCKDCLKNCAKCYDASPCKECSVGYYLYNDYCVPDCPQGYYKSNSQCFQCPDKNCTECNYLNATQCITCNNITKNFNGTCVDPCPNRYFFNQDSRKCEHCKKFCKTCNTKKVCDECWPPKKLTPDGNCVDSCQDGYVEINGTCRLCQTVRECAKCNVNNTAICDFCKAPLVLFENRCVDKCPDGYYADNQGKCARII